MIANWSIVREFNGDVKRLLGAWGLLSFGYFGILGVLFNLYLLRLGFSIEYIGILIASGQLLWAVTAIPAGAVGRRLGLRAAILAGYALNGVGISLILLVELLPEPAWSAWIIVGWLLSWVGAAFSTVNSTPYMMQSARQSQQRYAFAAQSAIIAVMAFMGGIVAGIVPGLSATMLGTTLDDPAPYRIALWIAPLIYLSAFILMAGASSLGPAIEERKGSGSKAPLALLLLLGLVVFLQTAGVGAVRAFFNIYLDSGLNIEISQIGLIMGGGQLLPAFVALATPFLIGRWGTERTLAIIGLWLGAALIILGAGATLLVAAFSFAAIVSTSAIGGTARNLFSQELVPSEWRTYSSAILIVGTALGWAVTAGVGGYLVETVGFRIFFFLCALLALLSTFVMLLYMRPGRDRLQAAAHETSVD